MSQDVIQTLEQEILDLKIKLAEMKRAQPPISVKDFVFDGPHGKVHLSDLFQGKPDLVLICNMGSGCRHCTLWADGFNGVVPELESRAGFVLISADPLDKLVEYAKKRSWRFQIASDPDGKFRKEMGFADADGDPLPGIIGFRKNADGSIDRIASSMLGEGDDFCPTWHMFDLLADGWNGWEPGRRL